MRDTQRVIQIDKHNDMYLDSRKIDKTLDGYIGVRKKGRLI